MYRKLQTLFRNYFFTKKSNALKETKIVLVCLMIHFYITVINFTSNFLATLPPTPQARLSVIKKLGCQTVNDLIVKETLKDDVQVYKSSGSLVSCMPVQQVIRDEGTLEHSKRSTCHVLTNNNMWPEMLEGQNL